MSTLELLPPPAVNARVASVRSWSLTVEQLAYLALGVTALLAHLWNLGGRSLHHDETLHAAYSWYLLVGRGYMHDPLLHGPLLYYLGALGYFLFGDNDFTARLMPALAGTALTLTPYLLRRDLGRPAALIAAVYLLISPVSLYVGRFLRHDIYSVLCEMLVFIAIVRYVATQRRLWLLVGAAAFGLMLINQETSYLFLLIMVVPLVIAFLWQIYRPGIALVAALGLLVVALIFILPGQAAVDGSHNVVRNQATGEMQVERPGLLGWQPLATEDNGYALLIRNRADDDSGRGLFNNFVRYLIDLGRFFGHPAVMLAGGLTLGTLAGLIFLIWRRPGSTGQTPWEQARAQELPAAIVFASLGEKKRWHFALALFLGIYLVGFTAGFTNLLGAISGIAGSLLYWLAQHNVQRGSQPTHYYLFQLGVYEPLLLLFGFLGLLLLVAFAFRRRRVPFPVLLVAWWSIAAFGLYSWAGEKMPWLTIHLTLPLTLLAAWAVQRVIWKNSDVPVDAEADQPHALSFIPSPPAWISYSLLFGAIVGLSMVLMTAIVGFGATSVLQLWVVPAAALALVTLLTMGAGLRWGWRPAAALLIICLGVTLGLATTRAAFRLAYVNGDVPVEPLVYTQTSPDVLRIIQRIEEASIKRSHGLDLPVSYDNETVWNWYLRDFSKAEHTSGLLDASLSPDIQAVFLLQENLDQYPENRTILNGFVMQRYPLRWWFPEDQVYRLQDNWRTVPLEQASLLGQLLRAPLDRDVNIRWWRFLMFRDPGHALGSTDFVIAVRPELANQIGVGFGGTLESR